MDFTGMLVINLYSIVILFIIYIQLKQQHVGVSIQTKIYMAFIKMTAWLIVMDIISWINSNTGTIYSLFNHFANFMLFACNLVLPSLWLLYVYSQVEQEDRKMRMMFYVLGILNCLNIVTVIISRFWGWFYYFDSTDQYHRGSLFALPVIFTIVLIMTSYFVMIKNRKKMETKQVVTLAFFAVLPCIGIVFQTLFIELSLMLNCLVISLLLVFLNIQNYSIYTDYLTGVHNRKKFDLYITEKIRTSVEQKTFSAIMLDMNNFKKINDTYGHIAGDNALRLSIRLLNSCLRTNDFIARIGGDEFCVILDISEEKELTEIIQRIENCFITYNATSNQPYELSFSMGYAVYEYRTFMKVEEFLEKLDELMYENKQCYKENKHSHKENRHSYKENRHSYKENKHSYKENKHKENKKKKQR